MLEQGKAIQTHLMSQSPLAKVIHNSIILCQGLVASSTVFLLRLTRESMELDHTPIAEQSINHFSRLQQFRSVHIWSSKVLLRKHFHQQLEIEVVDS